MQYNDALSNQKHEINIINEFSPDKPKHNTSAAISTDYMHDVKSLINSDKRSTADRKDEMVYQNITMDNSANKQTEVSSDFKQN